MSWLAPLGLGLVVTPIVLSRLGNESYGVYLVILGFISYAFPFNIGRTVTKYVSEFHAAGEDSKINDSVSSGFWLSLAIGLAGAAVIASISDWLVSDVLQVSADYQYAAKWALILGGFSIPAMLVGQVFQNVLQGIHRFGKVSVVTTLNSLFLNIGNVVLVVNGYGVIALLAWNLVVAVLIFAASFILARSHDRSYVPSLNVSRNMFVSVASYGFGVFFYQLFGVILLLFERGWLLRNFGAAESAFYLLPMTLALYMHSLVGSVALATFPAVNELLSDREKLITLYQKATKVIFVITAFAVATAISSGRTFLFVWAGEDFSRNAYTNLVFHFLTFGLIAVMIIIWQINEAHKAARINAIQVFIWAAVAIPLMIATSAIWSAEGVAASRLVAVVLTVPMLFYCEKRFFGGIFWRFWGAMLLRVGVAVTALAMIESVILFALTPSWWALIGSAAVGTLAFVGVAILSGLVASDERELILRLVQRRSAASA